MVWFGRLHCCSDVVLELLSITTKYVCNDMLSLIEISTQDLRKTKWWHSLRSVVLFEISADFSFSLFFKACFAGWRNRCHWLTAAQEQEVTKLITTANTYTGPYSREYIWGERPTRCHTIVYWTYVSLNMFRAPLCPSSGAGDYTDIHSMWYITLVMAGYSYGVWP